MSNISIREIEVETITGTYQTLIDAGDDVLVTKLMIRNTTTSRIRLRFDDNDSDTITIQPNEKMVLGGFAELKAKKIEAKSETNIASSLKVNLFS